jgi:hypothetical protein
LTVLDLLNLVGKANDSKKYALRKTARTLFWDSYRSQNGGKV